MVILSSMVTYIAQKASGAVTQFDALPVSIRFANAALSYVRYILKMLWPDPLSPYYYHELYQLNFMMAIGAAILLIAITAGVWFLRRNRPYMLAGGPTGND